MLENQSRLRYVTGRVRRQWTWLRQDGVRQLADDQLEPIRRLPETFRKWQWRRTSAVAPGSATALFVVGVQRSGTNMLVRALTAAPEAEIHSENDDKAFDRFLLRPDPVVQSIIRQSRHAVVVFKPLCDSHRADQLIDEVAGGRGKAIWAYRTVDGRVRSAVRKFGDVNRRVLAEIAAGGGHDLWQAQRLPGETVDLIRTFDYGAMSPESAAALFWYVRNSLYFSLGFDGRDDMVLASYDSLLADPPAVMRRLCDFVGLRYDDRMVSHVSSPRVVQPVDIEPRIRQLCDELTARLDKAAETV